MGYDFSYPNSKPGTCAKCSGSGVYRWGYPVRSGPCYSCKGTGKQSARQIKTNHAYNRHKLSEIAHGMFADRDPGFVDLDRAYEDQCADICGR